MALAFKPLALGVALCLPLALPDALLAETTPKTVQNGAFDVTIWAHPYLSAEDLAILNLVQTNMDALSVFVPNAQAAGFAALAISPDDGFVKAGQLQASAVAIADMPDAAAAAAAALAGCEAAKKGKNACELVLAVAPR